jgi:hypothetical protein
MNRIKKTGMQVSSKLIQHLKELRLYKYTVFYTIANTPFV